MGCSEKLIWWPELGMGHHPAKPMEYNDDYFAAYQERDNTPMGTALTAARFELVERHCAPCVVIDVGIGGGAFVAASGALGFDVSKTACAWLRQHELFADPYAGCSAISCWDSLEHIPEPEKLIDAVSDFVFVSMPIYQSAEDCIKSKHYKPGEHLWYWTHDGLIQWFDKLGFQCVEHNTQETILGREGIHSYAFRRLATQTAERLAA